MSSCASWLFALILIIALGLLSRIFPLGHPLWDKYLGDALYAAMVYALLRLFTKANPASLLVTSSAVMLVIEAFQLTAIPSSMLASPQIETQIAARLLGTQFSFFDLLAYATGIYSTFEADRFVRNKY
jgi:hypothetical protein